MLGTFIVAVIFMFAFALMMRYVSSGQEIIKKIDFEKYEVDKVEHESSSALGDARSFDRANPYEDKEVVAEKYREVFGNQPLQKGSYKETILEDTGNVLSLSEVPEGSYIFYDNGYPRLIWIEYLKYGKSSIVYFETKE